MNCWLKIIFRLGSLEGYFDSIFILKLNQILYSDLNDVQSIFNFTCLPMGCVSLDIV